jgi:outer membrane lipoprotein-sorting protein
MVNRFLRTAPTRTLLAGIAGVLIAIAGGTAIAVAATSGGPVPEAKPLASAVHGALTAPPATGFSADINFTNNLIGASELQGTDPLLQGGNGHIWVSNNGQLRLELHGDNGDPEIVVNGGSWWISDPALQTVYQGTLPAQPADKAHGKQHAPPSMGQIQTAINQLAKHLNISGAQPTDTGGQPTYTVTLTPKQPGGLLGQLQVAWDAIHGVPLQFAVYARHDSNPVLALSASNVSYGPIDPSVFSSLNKPSGYRTVNVATPSRSSSTVKSAAKDKKHAREITGVKAVSKHVAFNLAAPGSLAGLKRQSVSLTGKGAHRAALLIYGQGLGAIAVTEQPASASGARQIQLSTSNGDHQRGIILPTFSVHGAPAQELNTALGTFVRFTSGGVTYTLIGSVNSNTARAAARGL